MATALIAAGAAIVFVLGTLHLVYTFHGPKLLPRDRDLPAQMARSTLVLTRETTVWKAWIGFNASHSLGAMLFGAVYAYLALAQPATLLGSPFLLAIGAATLLAYAWLGRRYWFSVPFRGLVLALLLYAGGAVTALA
ncbi:MAG TPA: hypothetical protein VFK10_00380 [Burkholderiaceae bacterium]|nr:hypothetical protein [Burkholderiaceae bacterium]